MLAMEKLIEDLYRPYQDVEPDTKDVPKEIIEDIELDKFSEIF